MRLLRAAQTNISYDTIKCFIGVGASKLTDMNKIVGMLIQVLHGEYSDTRDLAVIQLVLIGERTIPPLVAFLKKEDEIEKDLNALIGTEMGSYHKAREEFVRKWGLEPDNLSLSGIYASTKLHNARSRGIEGSLKALTLLDVPNLNDLFPNLALVRKF